MKLHRRLMLLVVSISSSVFFFPISCTGTGMTFRDAAPVFAGPGSALYLLTEDAAAIPGGTKQIERDEIRKEGD
jgi:hypothetical protein